eukprot:scaffold39571_cov70-Phaeocystis_antarctica.AAC.7
MLAKRLDRGVQMITHDRAVQPAAQPRLVTRLGLAARWVTKRFGRRQKPYPGPMTRARPVRPSAQSRQAQCPRAHAQLSDATSDFTHSSTRLNINHGY